MLKKSGILTQRMALRIQGGIRLPKDLARPQYIVAHLRHQHLVAVVGLRKTRK